MFLSSLWRRVDRDHRQDERDFRRRQWVTVVVVVVGALVLAGSLRIEPGSVWFYLATGVLALVWAGGAFASGPLHLGRIHSGDSSRRPVIEPVLVGLALAGVFVAGALIVRQLPLLDGLVQQVLAHADQGSGPLVLLVTVVNGVAEELFFRGAVYASLPRHPALWSTVAYVAATAATGNLMLAFAALLLGTVAGLQRRASGGVLAPILTHITWSVTMLVVLPLLF